MKFQNIAEQICRISSTKSHTRTKEHSRRIVLCICVAFTLTPKPKCSGRPLVSLVKEKVSCLRPATPLRWRFVKNLLSFKTGKASFELCVLFLLNGQFFIDSGKVSLLLRHLISKTRGSDRIHHVFMSIHPHTIRNHNRCNLNLPTVSYLAFKPVRLVALPAVCH